MLGLNLALGALRIPAIVRAPAGPAGPTVNAVLFDGTNDFLARGADLTGAADKPALLLSMWFNLLGADGNLINFVTSDNNRVVIVRLNGGKLRLSLRSPANSVVLQKESVEVFDTSTNAGWNHMLFNANLVATPIANLFINDVLIDFTNVTGPTTADIDWTPSEWHIGAGIAGADKIHADFAEVYLIDEHLDITTEANRRKFIDASGKPVDLGADGSTPTGTVPLIFLSGDTDAWHTNKGDGGGFTETGALTDSATSPSD